MKVEILTTAILSAVIGCIITKFLTSSEDNYPSDEWICNGYAGSTRKEVEEYIKNDTN